MRNLPFFTLFLLAVSSVVAGADEPLRVLFLGDNGPHRPAARFAELAPALADRGILLQYTDRMDDLDPQTLGQYAGLVVYANETRIEPEQERALLDWVDDGGGFVALHSASYCFHNSDAYIRLVGAQFQRHGTGVFGTELENREHPVVDGFGGFRSWDESYIHHRHNDDRVVLEYRAEGEQAEGREREPWSWVRTHGQGRVFYTAWGHDHRTWTHPGFHNLVERGIRWVCRTDPTEAGHYAQRAPFEVPEMTAKRSDVAPLEYDEVGAKIPNYPGDAEQWGVQDAPLSQMQRPLTPEESIKRFVTPKGFRPELYAAEPTLAAKPIAMNWDEAGRLWVCQTVDYPNELRPPGEGNDRIQICEDTDRDGRADRFTTFAEGLSIPTAILCYRGGAIVQDGAETVFLKDTDGDGRADVRRVLISGWELGDTHGGVSNFRYGLDNWVWAMQGYNDSRPVIDGQPQQAFRMGFFRFRLDDADPPRVEEIEFLRSTDNNTWGLGISEEGLVFGSTANRNPSTFLAIPNRYYERVRGWSPRRLETIAETHRFDPITDRVRQVDHHGGYTAGAGHALYTARTYPQTYWNRTAFVCGPTGHLVGTFVLEPEGAGFRSHSPVNLIASDDEWSAPIQAEVGPDGNVWVLDWYNFIVQHNPTPRGFETGKGNAYVSDLRDKRHGRIYRVVDSPAAESSGPDLDSADAATLVATLRHPNMLWRLQAQRLLVDRGETDVADALIALVEDQSTDAIGLNAGAIHALWTLQGLGVLDAPRGPAWDAARGALEHPSAGVRRNAALVLPPSRETTEALLAANAVADTDAQVRLAGFLALADQPASKAAGRRLAAMADRGDITSDRWLADALTSAAAVHSDAFLPAFLARESSLRSGDAAGDIARRVAEHVARGRPAASRIAPLLESLPAAPPARRLAALDGLVAGWPEDHTPALAAATEAALVEAAGRGDAATKTRLITLGQQLGSKALDRYAASLAEDLIATLEDDRQTDEVRLAAAEEVMRLAPNDQELAEQLLDHVGPQASPEFAAGLIEAVSTSRAPETGEALIDAMRSWTPSTKAAAARVLLSRPAWTESLLAAIADGEAMVADLALDQRQALVEHPTPRIRRRARQLLDSGGGLPNADRQRVVERLMPAVQQRGDAERGKALFVEHCGKCHRHGELGSEIGPDLSGMAAQSKEELLVHILDPSRSVEGNFRTYTVLTVDGRVINGMLAGESKTSIELIDTAAERHAVQREDIERLAASTKSVMPDGFEDQLKQADMADLLEFLTQRGRFLPLDLAGAATVVTTRPMFYGSSDVERLVFDDWGAKTVGGVPFRLVDPQGQRVANAVMLHGPVGEIPPRMPHSVDVPINGPAKAIHILGGVGGWNAKGPREDGPTVMTVRLHYEDGATEDHPLRDGHHFADYIERFDVPGSEFAFDLDGRQVRYLTIRPERPEPIRELTLIKAEHPSAPVTLAITVESARE